MTVTLQAFSSAVHPEIQAERRRALRALLNQPLLPASGETAEEFKLVRRHSDWLEQWLAQYPSWGLHVHRDFVRLRKSPADLHDRTRPAIDSKSGTAFTRRRYALFCLALAVLERSDRQTTLGRIARSISEIIAGDRHLQSAGLSFDIASHDQRRDLIHAIRLLMDTGVLSLLDGDEKQFVNKADSTDALYAIHRQLLAQLLQTSRSPSAVEALETAAQKPHAMTLTERCTKLRAEELQDVDSGPEHRVKTRLMRALLDDPVLYFDTLDQDERNYFEKNRGLIFRQIHEATGLIAEHRGEGVAMVDDTASLTDIHFPGEDETGSLHLFLVQWLADRLKSGAEIPLATSEIEELIRQRYSDIPSTAVAQRCNEALLQLRALRLIEISPGGIVPLAAVGRWFNQGSS